MVPDEYLQRTSLHGAVLESFTLGDGVVTIACSSFLMSMDGDGDPHNVVVVLGGVTAVECDGVPVTVIAKEGKSGSVIDFSRDGDVATLVMEWDRYKPRDTITRLYTIHFRTFAITAEREGAG